MVAITAHHSPVGDQSLGRNPLVTRFIRGNQEAEASGTPKNAYLGFGCGFRSPFESSFWTLGRGSVEISYCKDCIPFSHLFLEESRWSAGPISGPHHVSSLRLVWWEHFCTPGRSTSPRCPQLFQSQSFCRHSVHLPFRMLTRKNLTLCVQCCHVEEIGPTICVLWSL